MQQTIRTKRKTPPPPPSTSYAELSSQPSQVNFTWPPKPSAPLFGPVGQASGHCFAHSVVEQSILNALGKASFAFEPAEPREPMHGRRDVHLAPFPDASP